MLIWFVIAYWVVSVGIGLWAALRVKNTADFAAAGHSLPMPIVTATVFATWFGSETMLGIPATFLKEGLGRGRVRPFWILPMFNFGRFIFCAPSLQPSNVDDRRFLS